MPRKPDGVPQEEPPYRYGHRRESNTREAFDPHAFAVSRVPPYQSASDAVRPTLAFTLWRTEQPQGASRRQVQRLVGHLPGPKSSPLSRSVAVILIVTTPHGQN